MKKIERKICVMRGLKFTDARKRPHIHVLKTLQPYYDDVESEKKPFEVRFDDRDFRERDILVLMEYNIESGFTGRYICRRVTYLLCGNQFGISGGFVVMGMCKLHRGSARITSAIIKQLRGLPV